MEEDIKAVLFAKAKEFNELAVKYSTNPQKGRETLIYSSMALGIENVIVSCGLYDEYIEAYNE